MPLPDDPLARLRPPPPTDEADTADIHVEHIAEVSRNARATWFGLLGILAFVGITLLAHKDADFFARGAATQLPLINISVPVEAFFVTAPLLVAAIYAYFHIYLISLWDALAEAPPRVGNSALADRVFPWLLNTAALQYRARARGDRSAEPRAMGWLTWHISLHLGWIFGIFILAMLWIRSMPVHDWVLSAVSGTCLAACLCIGLGSFHYMRRRMSGMGRTAAKQLRLEPVLILAVALVFILNMTLAGTGALPASGGKLNALMARANMAEAELTPRPADWTPFELWLRDYRRDRLKDEPDYAEKPEQEPLIPTTEEIQRWRLRIAALDAPQLKGKDLRGAISNAAFMPGADLRETQMQGATLFGAQMQGANCTSAAFLAALAQSANLTCKSGTLQAWQLQYTVGNQNTLLPEGLTVWSCLDEEDLAPEIRDQIETVIAHYPEQLSEIDAFLGRLTRASFRERLFCAEGQQPERVGRHPDPDAGKAPASGN